MSIEALPQPPEHSSPRPTISPTRLRRQRTAGMEVVFVESSAVSELHITATPLAGEPPAFLVRRLAEVLNTADATIVRLIGFGSLRAFPAASTALKQSLDDPDLPTAWVEGMACSDNPIAGIQVHAIAGTKVQTIKQDGAPDIRIWNDGSARHAIIGTFNPAHVTGTRPEQACEAFAKVEAGLALANMTIQDVARTWFFLDDILSWYGDFNKARNHFFAQARLQPGRFPASTGVSGRNPADTALTGAAWAVRPLDSNAEAVRIVNSPRQCGAPLYGSAFSRAAEIASAGCRQLLVSGTASIEPGGKTAHVGDVQTQIKLTMEVVESILISRRLSFSDVSRATAYFRHGADAPFFADWLERHELRSLPVVSTCCEICRDDLLFEIELDAIQPAS